MIFLSSCAAKYRKINPPVVTYPVNNINEGINFSYRYNVLEERGNKKLASKEIKQSVKILAVKIINSTDSTIVLGRNFEIFSGTDKLKLMEPLTISKAVKQNVPTYLFYLLGSFSTLKIQRGLSETTLPIGLVIGPGLTLINTSTASKSNRDMLEELETYNLLYKDIKKGETVYGLIGVRDIDFVPLQARKVFTINNPIKRNL